MLRIPLCLDNRLTDGGKVFNPTHPPNFTPQKHYYFYVSGTLYCERLSKLQGLVRPEGLGKFKNNLIGYRIRDLPVCSNRLNHFATAWPYQDYETFKHILKHVPWRIILSQNLN
jgi:hypothetical protein